MAKHDDLFLSVVHNIAEIKGIQRFCLDLSTFYKNIYIYLNNIQEWMNVFTILDFTCVQFCQYNLYILGVTF